MHQLFSFVMGLRVLLLAGILGMSFRLCAQDLVQQLVNKADSTALNDLYVDFAAPDLTAPTLLGVNTSLVSKPTNVRALAGSLLGAAVGFQQAGNGIGVEVAPTQLTGRPLRQGGTTPDLKATMTNYVDPFKRFFRGITLSGASITDSVGAKLATGIGLTLWDKTDPLLDQTRVEQITSRLRTADVIDLLHAAVQKHDQAVGASAYQAVVVAAGLPVTSGSAGEKLYDALVKMAVLPTTSTATPAQYRVTQQAPLQAWKAEVDKLVPAATLTQGKADKLKADGESLVNRTLEKYPDYQLTVTNYQTATQKIIKDANDEFAKRLWNATIVQAGAGWTWNSPEKTWNGMRAQSAGVFLRGAFRPARPGWGATDKSTLERFLYHHVHVVGIAQYNGYKSPPTNAMGLPVEARASTDSLDHKWLVGGRLLVGGAWFRVSGEYAMQRYSFTPAAQAAADAAKRQLRTDIRTATIGAELRLAEKLWLEFAFGTTYSASERKDARLLTLANLKYAIRNRQRFAMN